MTPRRSKREIERLLDDVDSGGSEDSYTVEWTDEQREQLREVYTSARENLSDEECQRLDDLEDEIEPQDDPSQSLSEEMEEYLSLWGSGLRV